ncbi:unnamed protein product [Fraxinus pennsylvanica]|uniref:Pentatricopeptide repeat-containing protein n=1 Tax=Fraxinus pennsylvanica TaxID=56036 RepID=A0AAD2EDY2_9LAMI|nr:unnamed protein product [Fraxinus pennsylvanica]
MGQRFIDFVALNYPNFQQSFRSLSAAVHVLVGSNRTSDAQALILRRIRRSGASRTEIVDSLVESYGQRHSQPVEINLKPVVYKYTTLIDGFCKAGEMEKAPELRDYMISKMICPNCIAYSALINGFCSNDLLSDAFRMWSEMVDKGIQPTIVTRNSHKRLLQRNGDSGKANEFLKKMKS